MSHLEKLIPLATREPRTYMHSYYACEVLQGIIHENRNLQVYPALSYSFMLYLSHFFAFFVFVDPMLKFSNKTLSVQE